MPWEEITGLVLVGIGSIGACYLFAWWMACLCGDEPEQIVGDVVALPREMRAGRQTGGEESVMGGQPVSKSDIAHRSQGLNP
jgi:hypothetical protein